MTNIVQKVNKHDDDIKKLSSTQQNTNIRIDKVTEGQCIVEFSEKWGFGSKVRIRIPGTSIINENGYCPEGILEVGSICSYKVKNGNIIVSLSDVATNTSAGLPIHGHSSSSDGGFLSYFTGTF